MRALYTQQIIALLANHYSGNSDNVTSDKKKTIRDLSYTKIKFKLSGVKWGVIFNLQFNYMNFVKAVDCVYSHSILQTRFNCLSYENNVYSVINLVK